MAKTTNTVSSELLIQSHIAERMDVSLLRDFVKELDARTVQGHVLVEHHRSDTGHLTQLSVRLTKTQTTENPPYPVRPEVGDE